MTKLKDSNSQLVCCINDLKQCRYATKRKLSNSKPGPYPEQLDWHAG